MLENPPYLTTQLITYLGNKRRLLSNIEQVFIKCKNQLGKEKVSFLDLFSGTGIVSRMARKHSSTIICNDLETYSKTANLCFHTNREDIQQNQLDAMFNDVVQKTRKLQSGWITELYAPKDDQNIKEGERTFYTTRNAMFLDTFCSLRNNYNPFHWNLLLGPILAQASIHVNTSGTFTSFYKNKQGIGQYGGEGRNALSRILKNIEVEKPVLSNFSCNVLVTQEDANKLVTTLDKVDIAYIDPPYNGLSYAGKYHLLNSICSYEKPVNITDTSGINLDRNFSAYNRKTEVMDVLERLIRDTKADFLIVSYSSDGFVPYDNFIDILERYGKLKTVEIQYNTFRACRNLSSRSKYVTEYLYILDKR